MTEINFVEAIDEEGKPIGCEYEITYLDKPIFIFVTHWHASLSDASCMLEKANELYNSSEINEAEYRDILSKIKKGADGRLFESEKVIEFIMFVFHY